jgi:hypothetical protein
LEVTVVLKQKAEQQIYRLFAACIFLAAGSWIVPRFVSNPEGGFAGAASAVVTLLVLLAVTLFSSLYLLTVTARQYRDLSTMARIAGIAPSIVLAAMLVGLFVFLSY